MCSMIANLPDLDLILPGTLMFSDVIDKLLADGDLSDARRRDLVSALRRLAKALGRPPEDVPCDTRWLQKRLGKISPAALGIATKTWQNAVSDARAAMAQVGIVERKINNIDDLVPEWHRLWSLVLESKDPTLQPSLSRFVYFLNRRGVLPEDVRQEHADAFLQAIEANEISKSPQVVYRAAVNGWMLAGRRLDAWPKTRLSLPSRQVKYILDLERFPPGFQSSYEDLFRRMTDVDPFADAGPVRPVRPSTLKQYRRQLLRFASDLVHSGIAIDEVADIRYLLTPSVAERGLRQMLARNGNETNRSIAEMSGLLRNLGRILDLPEDQRKALQRLAARTALPPQKGMTQKNRNRLLVLQDDRQTDRLLNFPEVLLRRRTRLPSRSCSSARSASRTCRRSIWSATCSARAMAVPFWSSRRARRRRHNRSSSNCRRTSCGRSTATSRAVPPGCARPARPGSSRAAMARVRSIRASCRSGWRSGSGRRRASK